MVEVDEHPRPPFYRRHPCACCCCVALSIVLLIVLIIIILAFTVFKPKKATVTVSNITLQNFQATLDRSGVVVTPRVNVTLSLDVLIHNPNRASVKHTNSSAMLYYHDENVGVVPIPAGVIGAHDTTNISTTLVVLADQLATNSHLIGDFLAGSLPFETRTEIFGKVKVFIIKKHVHILSQCDISISVSNVSITSQVCKNKVHL